MKLERYYNRNRKGNNRVSIFIIIKIKIEVKPQWIETIDGWIPGSLVNIISIKYKNYYISKEFLFNIKVKSV